MHRWTAERRTLAPWTVALALAACGSSPEGTLTIVTGEEADAFTRAPAPTSLLVESLDLDGVRSEIVRATLPADDLSLGDRNRSDVAAIAVTAFDPAGAVLLRGQSLYFQWGALELSPLEVFVQRTGELARVPRGPALVDVSTASMVAGRYVFATSGTSSTLYDLLTLKTLSSSPSLPRAPRSVITVDAAALVIDDAGASEVDLQSGSSADFETPTGGSWADVAGGATVQASDGSQYIVGGTRLDGGETGRVLVLDKDGKASFANLTAARSGACATWIEGRGLVVVGGSAKGAGVEVLAPGATQAAALAFPPDAVRGCGAAAIDTARVVVAGGAGAANEKDGQAAPRVIDLACAADCKAADWPGTLALVRAQATPVAPGVVIVVGDDAAGSSHVFRLTEPGMREVPLRTPRRGAKLVLTPIGAAAVVGGAPGLEQYLE